MNSDISNAIRRIKCVLIDVDNTLLDFKESSRLAIMRTCGDFAIEFSDTLLDVFLKINNEMWRQIQDGKLTKAQLWQTRWNKIFSIISIKADGVKFEKEFHRYLHECAVPIDGATEALEYLHSKYFVCTASNASLEQQRHRLDLCGMLKHIDKMFVSEQLGAQKPDKMFFEQCFKRLNYLPEEVLMIGDDMHADILGAYNYGLLTCWYNPEHAENPENIRADYQIANLSEIKLLF